MFSPLVGCSEFYGLIVTDRKIYAGGQFLAARNLLFMRSPAVREFWLSVTGLPAEVVNCGALSCLLINQICVFSILAPSQLLLKYLFPVIIIGIAYGNATASLRGRRGADQKLLPGRRVMPRCPAFVEPANSEAGR
jgi:hypothetical protein